MPRTRMPRTRLKGQWKEDIATGQIASGRMRLRNGDADVNTQSGRKTRVRLKAEDIRLSGDGNAFLVDIFYEVYEKRPDNTLLTWEGTCRCSIPLDARKGTQYAADVREYVRTWDVKGKVHDALEVPRTQGTCIADGSTFTIDDGGDDLTNAGVELDIRIPFVYFDTTP